MLERRAVILILVIVILLLATGLRTHRLGEQSLWYDEGVAYAHSLRTLPELIPLLQRNVHVPAYFTLLGWWQDLTGSSEFALRMLSALFSVISIAWTYALGARLFHPIAGVSAAALVALNSFSIYYAQEARMYAMLTAIAGASMWLFVGFMRGRSDGDVGTYRWRSVVGLGLLNAIGIYTHVVYALVILTQVVLAAAWFAVSRLGARRTRLTVIYIVPFAVELFLANALTLILFLPWLPVALSQVFAQPNLSQPVAIDQALQQILGYFANGITFELSAGNTGFVVYFFLLFGLLPSATRRWRSKWKMLLPIVWVLVSVAIYLYLGLTTRYLRFLLPAQIAFALWMGRGVWILWARQIRERGAIPRVIPKLAAAFALGAYLVTLFAGLQELYHHPDFQRDDMRGLASRIQADLREHDAVIVSAAGVEELLRYYYRAEAPVYGLPTTADNDATRDQVLDIVAEHKRMHVIFYGAAEQDPEQIVETTLNLNSFEVADNWVDDLRYALYISPADMGEAAQIGPGFGDDINLQSYALNTTSTAAGDILQVQLIWTANAKPSMRYKVFLQLLNSEGALVAQRDSEPAGGSAMTTAWRAGASIVDNHGLLIPPDLPDGDYRLIVGLYDLNDPAARLMVGGESHLELGTIAVSRAD